jgi:phosphoribosylamine--glycine ligase
MGERSIPQEPRVLVVGAGAREHAIVWKLAQSPHRPRLYAAPGNPGIEALATCVPIAADDVAGLVRFCQQEEIQLVVIGPEQPLAAGLVDACLEAGIRAFGPTQAAARLETSKAFAKQLMQAAGVPTARHQVFDDAAAAKAYIEQSGAPIVVKADGLAAGKGVVVAHSVDEARQAVDQLMLDGRFGSAGRRVVIESYLEGREASLMFFICDDTIVPMLPARDHKRIGEGDTGPNTGGMGAFAPVPDVSSEELADRVQRTIVEPTLAALRAQGVNYRGVLYVGLMLTADGPQVVEFNVRLGDPEAEVVLPLLETDLLDIAWATSEGRLADVPVTWSKDHAVCVVLAAAGYPEQPQRGDEIRIEIAPSTPADLHTLDVSMADANASGIRAVDTQAADVPADSTRAPILFHAGTARDEQGRLRTAGGRVLTVVGRAATLTAARDIAYRGAAGVTFAGKYLRRDIAARVVADEGETAGTAGGAPANGYADEGTAGETIADAAEPSVIA